MRIVNRVYKQPLLCLCSVSKRGDPFREVKITICKHFKEWYYSYKICNVKLVYSDGCHSCDSAVWYQRGGGLFRVVKTNTVSIVGQNQWRCGQMMISGLSDRLYCINESKL